MSLRLFYHNFLTSLVIASVLTFSSTQTAFSNDQFLVVTSPEVDASDVALISDFATMSSAFYEQWISLELDRQQKIVISGDPSFLAKKYVLERKIANWEKQALTQWQKHRNNEAAYGVFFTKTTGSAYQAKNKRGKYLKLARMVSHEVFHLFQYDAMGRKSMKCCDQSRISVIGPTWLMEGSAEFAMYNFVKSKLGADHGFEYRKTASQLSKLGNNFGELEIGKSFYKVPNSYQIGAYMTSKLIEKKGPASLGVYFAGLQKAQTWKKSFKNAFGVSVEEFYSSL